jgi:hypothetical protein
MAQISVPKENLALTIQGIKDDNGYILKTALSQSGKEVTIIYNPGITKEQKIITNQEQVMVNGPEGLKPVEGTILNKPTLSQPLITELVK